MAFTWNYTDMEISTLPDPRTSHSTKHGISQVLSMGLGGFDRAKMSDRKHLVRNFKRVKTLLKFSGIYVEDMKSGSFGFYFAMIRVFSIMALLTYKIIFLPSYMIFNENFDHHNHLSIGMMVLTSWNFKAWFSMTFLLYWQYRGYIFELFEAMNKFPNYCSSKKSRQFIYLVVSIAAFFIVATIVAALIHSTLSMLGFKERSMVDKRVQERIFYFWFSPYLTNFLTLVAFNIWVICLAFYTIVLNMLSGELESFNNSIKRDLENAPKHDVESILLEKFSSFLKMTDIVLKVNNIFEVYTFVMIGLNIPTSMFTLISFVVGLKASWESAVFSVPTIMFSVVELIGLTAIPAKVHATIHKVHHILYSIPHLWNPYNEKIYHITTVYMDHINQNDIGISLWGFALVTKPLILTTLSLIVSYLTILLQMKGSQ